MQKHAKYKLRYDNQYHQKHIFYYGPNYVWEHQKKKMTCIKIPTLKFQTNPLIIYYT